MIHTKSNLYTLNLSKAISMLKGWVTSGVFLGLMLSFGLGWAEEQFEETGFEIPTIPAGAIGVPVNFDTSIPTRQQTQQALAARQKALTPELVSLQIPKVVRSKGSTAEILRGDFKLLFQGRECKNCTGYIKQGYLTKLVHPSEGVWKLKPGDSVTFSTFEAGRFILDSYKVENDEVAEKAEVDNAFKAIDDMLKEVDKPKLPATQEPTFDLFKAFDELFTEFCYKIDNIPATKLFFLTATVLLIVFSIPVYRKLKQILS